MNKSSVFALMVVASMLGACEFASNAVVPSITGGPGIPRPAPIVPLDVSKLGPASDTSAGVRITQFRPDLAKLQQAAIEQVQRGQQLTADLEASVAGYQVTASTIKTTQPGGVAADDSVATWQQAQAQLRTVSATLDQMNSLSSEVAKNVAYAAYLQQSIQAASAAPDATGDDRRQLALLQDSTARTSMSLDQLLDGLRQRVLRQSHFLGLEGAKLAQIAPPAGVAAPSPAGSPQLSSATPAQPAGPAGAGLASGRPFVVIRFDNPGVEYEQQLYQAVSAALARFPNVAFDLVAAAPADGTSEESTQNAEAARASSEKVMQSLLNMGLPADRISVSQVTDPNIQNTEVRLYVR
ncbi:MAG: hypothetical protein R3D05_13105 [Dongiaceae bacterium]